MNSKRADLQSAAIATMRCFHIYFNSFVKELSLRGRNEYISCTPYGIVLSSQIDISLDCFLNKSKYSHNTYKFGVKNVMFSY